MATTSDLRTGIIIRYNNVLHRVVEFQHVSPGNWRAFVRMKLKNMENGRVIEDRVRAGSDIEIVRVDRRPLQYQYRDSDTFYFMDTETFEQIEIRDDDIGDQSNFMKEGETVDVLFFDETKVLGVELPVAVNLKVVEAGVAVRGDTATNVTKPAKLETGAMVQVPAFVSTGDTIRVDTRTGEYISRV